MGTAKRHIANRQGVRCISLEPLMARWHEHVKGKCSLTDNYKSLIIILKFCLARFFRVPHFGSFFAPHIQEWIPDFTCQSKFSVVAMKLFSKFSCFMRSSSIAILLIRCNNSLIIYLDTHWANLLAFFILVIDRRGIPLKGVQWN